MNVPRLVIDWLEWNGRPWWQRLWLRLTGRGFWRAHNDGLGEAADLGETPIQPCRASAPRPARADGQDVVRREPLTEEEVASERSSALGDSEGSTSRRTAHFGGGDMSFETMTDPYKATPVKPDPVVKPHQRRWNPFRRTFHWVAVDRGQPFPRGKVVWAEPWGSGGRAGGIKVCVVRRG